MHRKFIEREIQCFLFLCDIASLFKIKGNIRAFLVRVVVVQGSGGMIRSRRSHKGSLRGARPPDITIL